MSHTTTVSVSGMTCGHCVSSVTDEITALKGVQDVAIELNSRGLTDVKITSAEPLDPTEIGEAVAEAGYTVVSDEA